MSITNFVDFGHVLMISRGNGITSDISKFNVWKHGVS